MTRLREPGKPIPGWVLGLVESAEPGTLPVGSIETGENFVPTPAGLQTTRGGSRILLTLKDDAANTIVLPNFQANGALAEGTGAVSPAWPAHQADDVALLIVESANEAITLSDPQGFVEVADSPQGTGTAGGTEATRLAVFWKRATTGAEAAPTVADPGDHVVAQILTYRNVATTGDPWDVTAGNVQTPESTNVNIPGDTTTGDKRLVVLIVAHAGGSLSQNVSNYTNGDLADLTERTDVLTVLGNDGGFGVADGAKNVAGAYGVTTAVLDPLASVQGRMSIALKPAGVAGGNELTHACLVQPFTPVGCVVVGWSDVQNKHYAYRLTADAAFFTGTESTSRQDLTAAPSTTWANTTEPARPVAAELFEKLFLADATKDQTARNEMLSLNSSGTILRPAFAFDGGAASALTPYCLEEFNNHLFIAGYGDENDKDRPEMLRHSFLGRSPDDVTGGAEGFDKLAFLVLGAKGQRVTAYRKGRGLLLAAKDNELYRITGFGRAYPGWQFQVDGVHNTLGLGVSNPHALVHAEGFWYGVGAQGPFRTDGYEVETLVGPRQRSWRGINKVENAWVQYNPERRLILFGLHPSASAPGQSATYPWKAWAWDLERDVWAPDWVVAGLSIFHAAPIATTTAVGPSAPPSAPFTTDIAATGYTANWTNGDATAETELWQKEGASGTWTFKTVLAAGVATHAATAPTHTEVFWKVRHRKSGVTTDYTAEVSLKTLIAAPFVNLDLFLTSKGFAAVIVTQNAGGTDVILEVSPIGAGTWTVFHTFTALEQGDESLAVTNDRDYRAKSRDTAWPTPESVYSAVLTVQV